MCRVNHQELLAAMMRSHKFLALGVVLQDVTTILPAVNVHECVISDHRLHHFNHIRFMLHLGYDN
jgi:hypothetical protein